MKLKKTFRFHFSRNARTRGSAASFGPFPKVSGATLWLWSQVSGPYQFLVTVPAADSLDKEGDYKKPHVRLDRKQR